MRRGRRLQGWRWRPRWEGGASERAETKEGASRGSRLGFRRPRIKRLLPATPSISVSIANAPNSPCRIVGFDELEGGDNFSTASLELMLSQCGKPRHSLPTGHHLTDRPLALPSCACADVIAKPGAPSTLPNGQGFSAPKRPPRGGIRSGNLTGGDSGSDFDD